MLVDAAAHHTSPLTTGGAAWPCAVGHGVGVTWTWVLGRDERPATRRETSDWYGVVHLRGVHKHAAEIVCGSQGLLGPG